MRKNFLLVCMPKLESRASAGRMKSGKGPASWGDPSQSWGYEHGGGQKEAPCLEEDLSFIKVMGQDLCGLWDQPTLSLTSPTVSLASLHYRLLCTLHLLLSDFPAHQACVFLKSCPLAAPSTWHAVSPEPHMTGCFSTFRFQLRGYLLLREISLLKWKSPSSSLSITSHWFTSQSWLLAGLLFADLSPWQILEFICNPKSILQTLSWSFSDMCRVGKKFHHLTDFPCWVGERPSSAWVLLSHYKQESSGGDQDTDCLNLSCVCVLLITACLWALAMEELPEMQAQLPHQGCHPCA